MPAFEVVVVGSGGGPDETNLSAYLLKAHDARWRDGIIALEAGSGMGALNRLMRLDPTLFNDFHDTTTSEQATDLRTVSTQEGENRRRPTAFEVYSRIKCFLITHAHLDHISSLILSAGQFTCSPRRRIYAERSILKKLETAFEGKIWPRLASDDPKDGAHMLLYDSLEFSQDYRNIHLNISLRAFPLSHGETEAGVYESSAFLFRHDILGSEFVLCGDLEPDKVAKRPQTINLWRTIAPNISSGTLSTLFIECSWPSGRPDSHLYGHLTPEHLHDELIALATEVVQHRRHVPSTIGTTTTAVLSDIPTPPLLSDSTPVPVSVPAPIMNLNHNADSATTLPSRPSSPTHSTRVSLKRRASSFFSLLSPNKGHKRKSSEALNGNGNVSGSKGWSKKAKTDHTPPSLPPPPHRPASAATTCTTSNGDSESVANAAVVPTVDVPAQSSLPADESITGVLRGLKVYVMHCKEDVEGQYPGRPIGHVISAQVRALVESSGLGCEVLHADQGMRIVI